MSIALYKPCPTSNDLITRLIAKQAANNYPVIAQNAIDVLPTETTTQKLKVHK